MSNKLKNNVLQKKSKPALIPLRLGLSGGQRKISVLYNTTDEAAPRFQNVSCHVMNDNDLYINDCFSHFGAAMYMMQSVEKAVLTALLSRYENITKTRYDELMSEKSQLTFGQLLRDIESKKTFSNQLLKELKKFHTKRDWLAHNYWWDRAIEFHRPELRHRIIDELQRITSQFEFLCQNIDAEQSGTLQEKGLDMEKLIAEFSKFPSTPPTPAFQKLTKNEVLNDIFMLDYNGINVLIFELEDGSRWTLGESGLTSFNLQNNANRITELRELKGIFPVHQFNPSPKVSDPWTYELNLKKKGFFIEVRPFKNSDRYIFTYKIKKHGS